MSNIKMDEKDGRAFDALKPYDFTAVQLYLEGVARHIEPPVGLEQFSWFRKKSYYSKFSLSRELGNMPNFKKVYSHSKH